MTTNKLFTNNTTLNVASIPSSNMVSKVRVNREYLISKATAGELNTYVSFNPFPTFNDLFAPVYDENGKEITPPDRGAGTPGVRSIFNKAGAVIVGEATPTTSKIISGQASAFRISNNVPLMDNPQTRKAITMQSGCTVKDLVKASQDGLLGRETYSYSDFMYCKYLGRTSNNYLITLRRFPYPVDDFISSIGVGRQRANKDYTTMNSESLGCLVTWMGTPGNDMASILKYSFKLPFSETQAELQDASQQNADAQTGYLNGIAAVFDSKYAQQYQNGQAGDAANAFFKAHAPWVGNAMGSPPYPASSWNSFRDNTKVYGPVDVIKKTYTRGSDGLDYQHNITITFDYELRSYNGINGRQAMLDLLSNILNVTYSTGTFWGGGFRGGGAHQNNIFTNLKIFKNNTNGAIGFIDSFIEDCTSIGQNISGAVQSNGGWWETLKKFGNTLGGMLMAGVLNTLGRPVKQQFNSMLSPAPVGFWHLTIGNPHHPIMSMGNMILTNTTIEHYGPLGLDDFPTGIKVTCELSRGKSRDIRDIEKLYMHGNDRIYTSMGPKIFDMYQHSKEYRGEYGEVNGVKAYQTGTPDTEPNSKPTKPTTNDLSAVLQKYFGHSDQYSIMVASMEQENGAHAKKKKGTAGGDSSKQGNM